MLLCIHLAALTKFDFPRVGGSKTSRLENRRTSDGGLGPPIDWVMARKSVWAGLVTLMAGWLQLSFAIASTDQTQHTIWNPTPRASMREMSADRPDKTESPHTVDAGHIQLELDLWTYTYDQSNPGGNELRTDAFTIMPFNFKIGLLDQMDLQFVVETFTHRRMEDRGSDTTIRRSGFGDLITRLKINLWGNDHGKTAGGIMPFVKFPTNHDLGNDRLEGGVIFPVALDLPSDWGLGTMAEIDYLSESAGNEQLSLIGSITVGHAVAGNLGGYVEFFSEIPTAQPSEWVATIDTGLTCRLTPNTGLDIGVNLGITESADDLNLFTGLTWRH